MTAFDPNPRFENHMCHWPEWAAHFEKAAGDTGTLARMLGYAVQEIKRLDERGVKEETWAGALLYAHVMTCEALCSECKETIVPVCDRKRASIREAMRYIFILDEWRKEKRFGDLEP